MTNPLGTPTIGERQAIAEAIRKAKFEADKTYGIAWHHLEEISRVELIIAALATATTNAPVAETEQAAKIVYDAMLWAADQSCTDKHPQWIDGGNSTAQDEARRHAQRILSLTKNVATNADMRGALEEARASLFAAQGGLQILQIMCGKLALCGGRDKAAEILGWLQGSIDRADANLARTVLQGDQS